MTNRSEIIINETISQGFDNSLDNELAARRGSLKVAQVLHAAGLKSLDLITPAKKATQGALDNVRFAADLRRKFRNG